MTHNNDCPVHMVTSSDDVWTHNHHVEYVHADHADCPSPVEWVTPEVSDVRRTNGVGDSYAVTAIVTYPNEAPTRVTFTSSHHGAPIVMVYGRLQTFVATEVRDRLGSELSEEWVRGFFAPPK